MKYKTIVADPPWPYKSQDLKASPEHRPNTWDGETGGVAAKKRYPLMTMNCLKQLVIPAEDNAHLYLWFTNSFCEEAHALCRSWGFKKKTILTWVKVKSDGTPSMKMGYWFRGATEHILFGVRGKMRLISDRALPTAYLWPRLNRHSEKPEEFYDLVKEASPAPRLEMFARKKRDGYSCWGNEVHNDIEILSKS